MANTPVYTRGVKYIKIARIDANGRDNTNQLQNLTDIREVFSDISYPIQYNIVSVTEYPTYYLYSIIPTDVTSSANQEILDYYIEANTNTYTAQPYVGGYPSFKFDNYYSLVQYLPWMNSVTGDWELTNTPNITLQITASFQWYTTDSQGEIFFELYDINNPNYTEQFPPLNNSIAWGAAAPPSSYTCSFSGSVTLLGNTNYALRIVETGGSSPASYTSVNLDFYVTQSINIQASSNDVVVLEPYVDENFNNSDCNVLQNNVDINRFDGFFMEMDFTSGSILPQNQQAILNGSAVRAQVQPWNYTYTSQVSGRYVGKQQNAIAINVYTSASTFKTPTVYGFSGSWPGDTTSPLLQGSTVIQQLDSCVYTTNWAGGGYPENSYGGTFSLGDIMIVGENKDDVQLFKTDSPLYYQILNQNLPFNSTFIQRAYSPSTALSSQLTSLYPGVQLQDAAYWIPSNYAVGGKCTFYPTGSPSFVGQPYIEYSGSFNLIPTGIRNSSNVQQTGSGAIAALVFTEMYQDIIVGNPWFTSIYQSLGNIANGTDFYQYGFPFQITSITSSAGTWQLFIKNSSNYFPTSSNPYSAYPIGYSSSQSNTGILFAPGYVNQNQLVAYGDIWQDFSSNSGYLTLPYPKAVITQNANYITKQYGNNPNP
jgi:hypothetical protein